MVGVSILGHEISFPPYANPYLEWQKVTHVCQKKKEKKKDIVCKGYMSQSFIGRYPKELFTLCRPSQEVVAQTPLKR